MAFKEISSGSIVNPMEGESVIGYLTEFTPSTEKNTSGKFTLISDDKSRQPFQIWGCFDLEDKLCDAEGALKPEGVGRLHRLTFLGKEKIKGGKTVKKWKVERDDTKRLK